MADATTSTSTTSQPTARPAHAAATEAAQSVAEAVKRVADAAVADAAVAEVQKVKTEDDGKQYDFPAVSGKAGGRFTIRGSGFGPGGSVHVGKAQAEVLSWSTQEITGRLPASVADGEIVVHVDDKVKKRGKFTAA